MPQLTKRKLMNTIHKKFVVDEQGNPTEVIIPWLEFVEIAEALGLDLGEAALDDLAQAQADRASGNRDAFLDRDQI